VKGELAQRSMVAIKILVFEACLMATITLQKIVGVRGIGRENQTITHISGTIGIQSNFSSTGGLSQEIKQVKETRKMKRK
jgi:hypothetical protein